MSLGSGDEQSWLSIHNADAAKVDRKGAPGSPQRIYVRHAAVSIVGTIQPEVARKHLLNEDNLSTGLAARMLLARPPVKPARWTDYETPTQVRSGYERVVQTLFALSLLSGEPRNLVLDDEAHEMFVGFHDDNGEACAAAGRSGDEHLAAMLSKARGAAARIALVLALARAAEDGDPTNLDVVDGGAMAGGIAIARYFEHEARRLYTTSGHGSGSEPVPERTPLADEEIEQRLMDLLGERPRSRSELRDAFGRNIPSERLGDILSTLLILGLVDSRKERSGSRGRPREVWFRCEEGISS